MQENNLSYDGFLRSIQISKDNTYALLLGAGCSISSNIPSAYDCIWEWKYRIYQSNNQNIKEYLKNCKHPKSKEIIQNWLDSTGKYLPEDDPNEYSFYAEKCYPILDDRRQYFQKICSNKQPSIGYRLIPFLFEMRFIDSIWTTNFDDLVRDTCIIQNVQVIDIALDSANRINNRAQNSTELPVIKLHGDYKYGELKNTKKELQDQDEIFREKLINYLSDKHLIVLGYSGRDISLMDTLKEAYSKPGSGRLYWCGYGNHNDKAIRELLKHVQLNEREAFYISTNGFDSTIKDISQTLSSENPAAKNKISKLLETTKKNNGLTPFSLNFNHKSKVLKSNCFKIEIPNEVFIFDTLAIDKPWRYTKDINTKESNISAVPFNKGIVAFGLLNDINRCFNEVKVGDIKRKTLVNIDNSILVSLILSTVCKTLSQELSLSTNYKNKVWKNNNTLIYANRELYNAIRLSMKKIDNNYYITLNPDFELVNTDLTPIVKQSVGKEYFYKLWNSNFSEYLDSWRNFLFSTPIKKFPTKGISEFQFKISRAPFYSFIYDQNSKFPTSIDVNINLLNLSGIQFKESELLFSTKHGNRYAKDSHPMRGLVENKPYEANINSMLNDTISFGVICTKQESQLFYQFLSKQQNKISRSNPKDNYVVGFEGFHNIYGIHLNIPLVESNDWLVISEPEGSSDIEKSKSIKNNIIQLITKLCSIRSQKIIVIMIPDRWENFTKYDYNGESFDLHNYIKAFCIEKGVTSQFVREKTVRDFKQSCQIAWWLSLSFYVKSFRTPWVLSNSNNQTAFAGIGYSIDKRQDNNNHIVLGCSHIYSSSGEGLKYKLSKIRNEKIRWKSKRPHLCYDDAYEFGNNIINLFYQSMQELPKRVVIHKRTFFTDEEKNGILDSLLDNKMIESVDLIEISFENDIKYLASKKQGDDLVIDTFPVSRGTCIQTGDNTALLYVHGVIPSVQNPNFRFFPGGRYIPKPLRITKHYGTGDLETIANEILGLTKMNWNSLNMYSQLPATIISSNEIAKIGDLLSNNNHDIDYRYFI